MKKINTIGIAVCSFLAVGIGVKTYKMIKLNQQKDKVSLEVVKSSDMDREEKENERTYIKLPYPNSNQKLKKTV